MLISVLQICNRASKEFFIPIKMLPNTSHRTGSRSEMFLIQKKSRQGVCAFQNLVNLLNSLQLCVTLEVSENFQELLKAFFHSL